MLPTRQAVFLSVPYPNPSKNAGVPTPHARMGGGDAFFQEGTQEHGLPRPTHLIDSKGVRNDSFTTRNAKWNMKLSFENRTSLLHIAVWNWEVGWNAGAVCLQPVICQPT